MNRPRRSEERRRKNDASLFLSLFLYLCNFLLRNSVDTSRASLEPCPAFTTSTLRLAMPLRLYFSLLALLPGLVSSSVFSWRILSHLPYIRARQKPRYFLTERPQYRDISRCTLCVVAEKKTAL